MSRSYLILFYPIFFFGKILFCPIFGENVQFYPIFGHFPLILVLQSFYHHYFTQDHSFKNFSLASLSIKILFVPIMLESIFFTHFTAWCPIKYVNVGENKLFSWEKSYFCPVWMKILALSYFWGCNVLFFYQSCYLTPWNWS